MLCGGMLLQPDRAAAIVLSGQSISYNDPFSPWDAHAILKVDSNGNVYESEGGGLASYVQIDSAADWKRPVDGPGVFHVRATLDSGDALTVGTVGLWMILTSDRVWQQSVSGSMGLFRSSTLTIEISNDGGTTVVASAVYSLTASTGL